MIPSERLEERVMAYVVDRDLAGDILDTLDAYRKQLRVAHQRINQLEKQASDASWSKHTQMGAY